MFLREPHITTRNFRQLTAKVGKEMFAETDKLEPYYVAAFALYRLEQLFRAKKIETKYKAARFQILLVVRYLLDDKPFPPMNSHEMAKRCAQMIAQLQNDDEIENPFTKATDIVDEVAGGWNRDSIRTEPITKAIIDRFSK
jgi:hypothetical protein